MTPGRRGDSARRGQRVLKALNNATNNGEEISVSGIARSGGVDRSFLYCHSDLLEQIHAIEAQPPNTPGTGPAVSRASMQADLLNAQQRAVRLAARVHQVQQRLSEALGEQPWHESGLGTPTTSTNSSTRSSPSNCTASICGSKSKNATKTSTPPVAANRELMAQLNAPRSAT